jgi:hypothetical protein
MSTSPFYKHSVFSGGAWAVGSSLPTIPATMGVCGTPDFSTLVFTLSASPFILMLKKSGEVYSILDNPSVLPTATSRAVSISDDGVFIVMAQTSSPYFIVYKWNGSAYIKLDNPIGSTLNVAPDDVYMDRLGKYVCVSPGEKFFTYLIVGDKLVQESKNLTRMFRGQSTFDVSNNALVTGILKPLDLLEPIYTKLVKFNTAPILSDVITADYIVDGVHKTDQYVIDTSFAIQFGEVV